MNYFAASDMGGFILVGFVILMVLAIAYGYYNRGRDKDINQRPQGAEETGAGRSRIAADEAETKGAFDTHGTA